MAKSSWNSKNPPPPRADSAPVTPASAGPGAYLRLVLALLIIFGTLALTLYYYPQVPDRIPTHFGKSGLPNGFGPKSPMLFMPCFMQWFISGIVLLSRLGMKDQKKRHDAGLPIRWFEKNRELNVRLLPQTLLLLDGILFVCLLLFLHLDYAIIAVAMGRAEKLSPVINFYIAFLMVWAVGFAIYLIIKAVALKKSGKI